MASVTGAIVLRVAGVGGDHASSSRSVLSRISRCHCSTAVVLVVRTSVFFLRAAIAAMPTIVLPAPQGRTITPEPPRTSPPAWKASTAILW